MRASSVGNVGSGGNNNGSVTTTLAPSSNGKPVTQPTQQQVPSTVTSSAAPSVSNVPTPVKTPNTGHHLSHSHHHHNVSQSTNTGTTQSGNFATVAAANAQHLPATSTSYNNKITTGMLQDVIISSRLVYYLQRVIVIVILGHMPTENGLPPYSTGNASTNLTPSSTSIGTQNPVTNYNEQHSVNRLSTSPSLSVHSGPSPVPANSTPPYSEQSSLTPMKSMTQNQDPMERVILDMPHLESSRSTFCFTKLKLRTSK